MRRVKSNHPILPRRAAHRTISDLSRSLTAAGYDPSRIEERAAILAKAAGMKRKRDNDEDMEMDGGSGDDWSDEEMDVDGEDTTPRKKMRTEKGAKKGLVTAVDRTAKTNRRLAGLGGPEVRAICRL